MSGDRGPLLTGALLALALALILAAHEVNRQPNWSLFAVYIYWAFRIGMTYLIIVGAYAALAQALADRISPYALVGLSTCLSFAPLAMAVTMLDLAIGDAALLEPGSHVLIGQLRIEAISLIDVHLMTSALLLAPYLLDALSKRARPEARSVAPASGVSTVSDPSAAIDPVKESGAPAAQATALEPETPGLLLAAQPSMRGDLLAAEAQEHYVKLKATEQGGMALYRFGDAVRELSRYPGMQIHRSHWVADAAVVALLGKRGALKLKLITGEVVPVSRRYELEVEARYGDRERRAETVLGDE